MDNTREAKDLWGNNPVYPPLADYKAMANGNTTDFGNLEAKYTNPPRVGGQVSAKQFNVDRSLQRAGYVGGRSAACREGMIIREEAGRPELQFLQSTATPLGLTSGGGTTLLFWNLYS